MRNIANELLTTLHDVLLPAPKLSADDVFVPLVIVTHRLNEPPWPQRCKLFLTEALIHERPPTQRSGSVIDVDAHRGPFIIGVAAPDETLPLRRPLKHLQRNVTHAARAEACDIFQNPPAHH